MISWACHCPSQNHSPPQDCIYHMPFWFGASEPRTSSLELTAIYPFKEKKESEAAQSCPTLLTLCNPVDCSPSGSSVRGILQAGMLEGVSHFLLQGISPTQGLNPGLPHCRQTLYRLSHQGSPRGI